ncbi:MAG TPA: homoserine kinase [Anaerolineales bacterium]|nr:homoserine kinase [Anaerolineales bacterium]HNQ94578.1 homoserine kinase [Anaerolineales bacterium]HNS62263.1 homoserine kinase [Anaerolineales bacterium]
MKINIHVPATSANLGPGFDTLGLALDLWNETIITSEKEFSVQVTGEGAGRLASGKNNLIVRAAQRLAEHAGKSLPPFHAECANQIPLSSGMGSSSAAILTGLLAGNALLENPFSREEILNLACEMEGHPDNVAPAMMGGLVVSTVEGGRVIAQKISVGMNVHVTIVLPNFYLPTKQARMALPKKVSMRNAIHNIGRTALVVEAFRSGDLILLGKVMSDKLHQPYRLRLIPGAASAMDAAKEAGASAVALSGAGPSVIAFSTGEAGVGESMKRAYEAAGVEARIFRLGVSSRGAELGSRE